MSQFIEMFSSYQTTPVGNYIEDSYPGEWGTEDKDGNGIKVIRTTNFTNSGKLDLTDVITRSILEKKIERKVIRKYDTILERSGGTADNPVGRVVLFEEDEQYLCNNFTQVLRFKKVDPIFAFYSLFYFYQTNKMVVSSMGSKTTGIQNLNMSRYLEIGIPNASDNEQKKFVVIAKQADKSKFGDFKSQFIEMFSKYPSETPWHKLLNIINGKAYPEEYNNIGTYPICGSAGIMYYGERKLCDANTIILGRKGNINHPIYMESDYWIVDTAFCLDVNKSILHPKYFYYWCCQYDFTKLNKQGVLPSLTRKDLEKIEMSIPPMAEQKKFVSIVEQADKSKSYVWIALKNLESMLGYYIRQVA